MPAPVPRWLLVWMAVTGLVIGATVAVLVTAVIVLHTHDHALDVKLCAEIRADRAIDVQIVTAAGLHVAVPPLTSEECP